MERMATTREIARLIWDQLGRPQGRDLDIWLAAEKVVQKLQPTSQQPQKADETQPFNDMCKEMAQDASLTKYLRI